MCTLIFYTSVVHLSWASGCTQIIQDDLFILLKLTDSFPQTCFPNIAKYRGFEFKGASCVPCLAHYANERSEKATQWAHTCGYCSLGTSHNSPTSSLTYRESVFLKLRNGRLLASGICPACAFSSKALERQPWLSGFICISSLESERKKTWRSNRFKGWGLLILSVNLSN